MFSLILIKFKYLHKLSAAAVQLGGSLCEMRRMALWFDTRTSGLQRLELPLYGGRFSDLFYKKK